MSPCQEVWVPAATVGEEGIDRGIPGRPGMMAVMVGGGGVAALPLDRSLRHVVRS